MKFVCGTPVDKKILAVIIAILGALIIAVTLCSCSLQFEDWELQNPETEKRPHNVNEKVRPFFNKSEDSHGDFLIYVGKYVNNMESRGLRIYKIRVDLGRDVAGKYKIYTVWVYYD